MDLLSLRTICYTSCVPGQPRLCGETLLQKTNERRETIFLHKMIGVTEKNMGSLLLGWKDGCVTNFGMVEW